MTSDTATDGPRLSYAELAALLRAHGINPTQQRIEIAQVLLARMQHLSAEQVLSEVNKGRALVSKATVYNTLGLFARKGLVREVIVDPSRVFYDSNVSAHHHFFNIDTGSLADIPPGVLDVMGLPEPPPGTTAVGIDVVVRVRKDRS